jgi:hypothetical protein
MPIASLTSREAPCDIWLNPATVSMPEHMPPTSPTACARGQTYSGHHRRRPAPRCDRQDLPDLTQPFTGPPSPPVSHATLFPSAVTVAMGKEPGWKKEKPGGFCEVSDSGNSSAGAPLKGIVKGNPRGLGANWFSLNLLSFILLNEYRTCKIHNSNFIQPNLVKPILLGPKYYELLRKNNKHPEYCKTFKVLI